MHESSADSGGNKDHFEMNGITFRRFDTVCSVSADVDGEALAQLEALCADYELLLSRFDPRSRLFALNAAAGAWVEVGEELARVLQVALAYCARTGGLFDITMGGVCRLWDFKRAQAPEPEVVSAALSHVDWHGVEVDGAWARLVDPQACVDLGGIAKGYIADRIVDALRGAGATTGVVNLGGNVVCLGGKPDGSAWSVGLRAPLPSGGALRAASFASVAVRGRSVVTSGVYERAFVREGRVLHHILDPRTGMPAATDVLSATVVSEASLDGDGFTTALVIMGAERALAFAETIPEIEVVLLTTAGEILHTSGVRGKGPQLQVG